MNVHVDMDKCALHGQCSFAAPEVFDFDDNDDLVYDTTPDESQRAAVEQALRACPVVAIEIRD
ncbi:ferredoxin [Streptomyces sp. NPDC057253]|uniref:ferredoxin n=1 Tax=Streptomyces sp. NPDC057253 TaxID=3346069 RepID=UPI00362FE07C